MIIRYPRVKFLILALILAFVLIQVVTYLFKEQLTTSTTDTKVKSDTVLLQVKKPVVKFFGFNVDSIDVIEDKVKRNQNVAEILSVFNVEPKKIYDLSVKSKKVFDLRKINVNRDYKVILGKSDSIRPVKAFVYEPNQFEYIYFGLGDSIIVKKHIRKTDTLVKTISGEIEHSLYENMLAAGGSAALVNRMVDVFGWQVDFFRLNKGDQYKLIYEEIKVNEQTVGIGRIIGGFFNHFNQEIYAIRYDQGAGGDFFDLEGNSLRKAFLRAPVEYTRISSRYSGRRYHPVQKRWKAHLGTDYAAPRGTPIRAVGDGIITEAKYKKYNGKYVKIRHNSTYSTQYLHMSGIAKGIRPGARVKQGQTIGYVGSTGLATGNHVCYRFWKNGVQVDPLKVEIPPSKPIKPEHLPMFMERKKIIVDQLDQIQIPTDLSTVFATIK
jgi:murein DD-endopeptidase MepM/ murein hydrolase activator NlpD